MALPIPRRCWVHYVSYCPPAAQMPNPILLDMRLGLKCRARAA